MNHLLGDRGNHLPGNCREKTDRGSKPILLPLAQSDTQGMWLQNKCRSVDFLRNKTPDLWPIKSASLAAICKWKQTLTERLLKRHQGSYNQVSELLTVFGSLPKAQMALAIEHGLWKNLASRPALFKLRFRSKRKPGQWIRAGLQWVRVQCCAYGSDLQSTWDLS
ncbi:disks large homolog 2 isoform X25 [Tachysurus ichikawai]